MNEPHKLSPLPKTPKDPTAASKTWAIALVVSALLLVAAIGIITWLVISRTSNTGVTTPPPVDPAVGVKNASYVLPADMPAAYIKNDQSRVGESLTFYDDEAAGCSIVLGVVPADSDKTAQDAVLNRLATAYAPGVTMTEATPGERFVVKDADGTHEYSFESVDTRQSVDVPGVGYTGRQQITLFKKLGNQIAFLGYGCKTESWATKQTELATLVGNITIKTER